MVCLSTKLKISTLTLNNLGHLASHLLDVLVLGDGAVEVFWSIQRQPINVCCEEKRGKSQNPTFTILGVIVFQILLSQLFNFSPK